ncbi:MAG: hypothetical protein QF662_03005, partial [Phycisphaerae bacterium]|nr:hypothetical protein [Phycisphaerae bacterium]
MSILDTLREIWPARLVSCAALLALSSVVMLCLAGCIPPGPEQTGVRFGQVEVLARAKGFFEGPAYDAKTGNLYYVNVGDREGRVWQIDPEG